MIQSKLIRPTKFPLPLKQLDCESPFSNLKSSDLLRQSSDDLLAFSAFKPQATDLFQPIRRPLTRNQTSSPTDSGVSVGSYDSSELTPSSSFVPSSSHMPSSSFMPSSSHMPSNMPSSITPIDDGWSSNRFGSSGFDLAGQLKTANDPFGAIDQRSSTAFGQFDLFSSTDRLADIWKPSTEPRSSNFDPFTSQSATKSAETRPAGRPLLNSLGKLSDRDVAYESDYGWKAATSASRDHLDATFVDAKRFGASVEQCDTDCNACYKRCDDCTQFSALLDLAEKSYQANYKDITYSEYLFGICSVCVWSVFCFDLE